LKITESIAPGRTIAIAACLYENNAGLQAPQR
jgi:hypothetical protein